MRTEWNRRRLWALVACFAMAFEFAPTAVSAQGTSWICNGVPATIVGTAGNDEIIGTPGDDVIVARQGADVIRAGDGDDTICAGRGDDVVFGGLGFDILFGAQGNDILYSSTGSGVGERADIRGARIFGGAGGDRIYGSSRWDRMQGGPGVDFLYGYEGQDWLRAGPGRDLVDGGAGTDDLHGGNGDDIIELTEGDTARGGAGNDLCIAIVSTPSSVTSCGLNVAEGEDPLPPVLGPHGWLYSEAFPDGEVAAWIRAKPVEAEETLETLQKLVCSAIELETTKSDVYNRLAAPLAIITAIVRGSADTGLLATRELSQLVTFGYTKGGCSARWDALG